MQVGFYLLGKGGTTELRYERSELYRPMVPKQVRYVCGANA